MEGEMSHASSEVATLDEPVSETILRDLKAIGVKLKYVLLPVSEEETIKELQKWDLWGPLLLCLVLSIILSAAAPAEETSVAFAAVFVIVWVGAFVVTLNAQLLGGSISCFQSVCVLGYCIFPLVVASIMCKISSHALWKGIVVGVGFLWATRASVVFMSQLVPAERKVLAVYPVTLFYIVISWMIFIS